MKGATGGSFSCFLHPFTELLAIYYNRSEDSIDPALLKRIERSKQVDLDYCLPPHTWWVPWTTLIVTKCREKLRPLSSSSASLEMDPWQSQPHLTHLCSHSRQHSHFGKTFCHSKSHEPIILHEEKNVFPPRVKLFFYKSFLTLRDRAPRISWIPVQPSSCRGDWPKVVLETVLTANQPLQESFTE